MRVLRILTRANVGGPARQALALWDRDTIAGTQTLLAIGACAKAEPRLDLGDRPILEATEIDPAARGIVALRKLGRTARPWRDAWAVHELRQIIRGYQPDVVHTHTSQAGLFGRRAAFAEGVPVVAHTFHGHVLRDYYPPPLSYLLARLEARLARRTDVLLAVSASCRSELAAMGIGDGRLEVMPPAVDLAPFAATSRTTARRRLGLTSAFALGFVGRLVAVKRPEMFARLVASLDGVQGFVLGEGPLQDSFTGIANLRRLGVIQDPESYLAGLDALVLTSRREGCPLVALEAMAAGVPVIGLDVPGVRDVLTNWGAGILVPAATGVAGLAAAVENLRSDRPMAERLRATARRGLDRFSPDVVARRLAACYARCAKPSQAGLA